MDSDLKVQMAAAALAQQCEYYYRSQVFANSNASAQINNTAAGM